MPLPEASWWCVDRDGQVVEREVSESELTTSIERREEGDRLMIKVQVRQSGIAPP